MWTRFDHTGLPDKSWPPEGVLVLLRQPGSADPPEIAYWQHDQQPDLFFVDWWDRENECHYGISTWDEIEWSPLPQVATPTTLRLEREVGNESTTGATMWTRFDRNGTEDELWPPEDEYVMVRDPDDHSSSEIARWTHPDVPFRQEEPWEEFPIEWWDVDSNYLDLVSTWDEIEWSPLPQVATPTTQRLEREVAERYGLLAKGGDDDGA